MIKIKEDKRVNDVYVIQKILKFIFKKFNTVKRTQDENTLSLLSKFHVKYYLSVVLKGCQILK